MIEKLEEVQSLMGAENKSDKEIGNAEDKCENFFTELFFETWELVVNEVTHEIESSKD